MTFKGRHPPFQGSCRGLWKDRDLSCEAGAEMLAEQIRRHWERLGAVAEVAIERVPLSGTKASQEPMWRARLVAVRAP